MSKTPLTADQLKEMHQEISPAERAQWRDSGFDYGLEKLLSRYEFSLARLEARLRDASWIMSQLQRYAPNRAVEERIQDWIKGA